MGKFSEAIAPLVATFAPLVPTATPDNTPIPGGGSWRWAYPTGAWIENLPDSPPLQPQPKQE